MNDFATSMSASMAASLQGTVSAAERSMRSVFVGNIPYEATEEQLKDIFSEVGPVVSFRLVYDRETGKPKGYGFCEYKDQETALSAMRNLNGYELNGRPLRVDNAASEKSKEELKNLQASMSGPPVESPYGTETEPDKAPEAISKAVASLPPEQMFELMKQMKLCIQNNPNEARNMLLQNPQLAYALLQAQVIMRIVDPQVALGLLHRQNQNQDNLAASAMETDSVLPGLGNAARPSSMAEFPSFTEPYNNAPAPAPAARPSVTMNRPSLLGDRPPAITENSPSTNPAQPQAPIVINPTGPFPGRDAFDTMLEGQNMGDRDMRGLAPHGDRDLRGPMAGMGDRDLRQNLGDQDLRRMSPSRGGPKEFDPRFRGVSGQPQVPNNPGPPVAPAGGPITGRYDPRTGSNFDIHRVANMNPGRPEDPRTIAQGAMIAQRGQNQPPRINLSNPGAGMPTQAQNTATGGGGQRQATSSAASISAQDQEKAALIMQVLQLSDQQISMLPPEQRQSILILKEQIARSAQH